MTDFTKLKEGLPFDPLIVDDNEVRVSTSIGSFWFATCSTETVARAIAAIPEMLAEIERLRTFAEAEAARYLSKCSENARLRSASLPEEIARLCDWLRLLVNEQAHDAAAALERMAREVEQARQGAPLTPKQRERLDAMMAERQAKWDALRAENDRLRQLNCLLLREDPNQSCVVDIDSEDYPVHESVACLVDDLRKDNASLSSLLLTARENEKALASAVAKREEEAMALTRVAEHLRQQLRKNPAGMDRVIEAFDSSETANSFLSEDGEGGFAAGVYRMTREVESLRAENATAKEAHERTAHQYHVAISELDRLREALTKIAREQSAATATAAADKFQAIARAALAEPETNP